MVEINWSKLVFAGYYPASSLRHVIANLGDTWRTYRFRYIAKMNGEKKYMLFKKSG